MVEYRNRRNDDVRRPASANQRPRQRDRRSAGDRAGGSGQRSRSRDQRVAASRSDGQRGSANRSSARRTLGQAREYRDASLARYPRTSGAYSQRARAAAQVKRPVPAFAIIVAIAAVCVIVLAVLGIRSCAAHDDLGGDERGAQAAATVENDGSVVLTLLGDEDTVVLAGEDYIESGAQAIDRNRGQLTQDVKVEGEVDTSTPGTYQVTYSVENADGMRAERVRNVHVVESMDADEDGVPVMMYHWVYRDDQPPDDENTNYISVSKLEAQLQWLTEEGYYFPSHQEIRAYVDGTHSLPAKSVVLTFDDGEIGFLEYGIPLFEKYKVPATSYVIGDNSATPDLVREHASEYVSFQSHSYGLHNGGSSGLGRGGIIYDKSHDEIVADEQAMVDMLGVSPSFAYPFGDVSDDAPAALAEAGVLCAYTVNYGNVCKGDDPMRLNRVRVFGESELAGFMYQVETGE